MKYLSVIALVLITSCKSEFNADLSLMQGYWEIEQVIKDKQVVKEYKTNLTVDFIEISEDSTGLRKKLAPVLDGSFAKTKSTETFKVRMEAGRCYLDYSTPYADWTEELIELGDDLMILEDEQGAQYWYKPYTKIELDL